jgi:hypothetical protein
MNIEERLEGLTHTVELLAGMQVETEKRMTRLTDTVAELAEKTTRLETSVSTLVEGMTLLTRVTLQNQDRIDNLEGNRPL